MSTSEPRDKARHGEWQLFGRRGRSEAVLAGAADLSELLGTAYRLHPEVETHGVGDTLHEALADLADAMVEYAEDWVDHLRHAADHRPRAGYVRRIQLAGDVAGVLAMLERDADAVSEAGGADATQDAPRTTGT